MESNASHKIGTLRKLTKALAVAAVVGLTLTGCSGGAGGAGGEGGTRQLLLGHGADPSNPRSAAADFFKDQLAETTGGQLTVQVQGSEQLGSDSEMMVSVASGTLDLTANSQGAVSSRYTSSNQVCGRATRSPSAIRAILDRPIPCSGPLAGAIALAQLGIGQRGTLPRLRG